MTDFNDTPISQPKDDQFGLDAFAIAIADCIDNIDTPEGSVIAVHGPWGSGKTSAVNLVRHHLDKASTNIIVIPFPCWEYRTEDALALGFFKELVAGLNPSLSKSKKAKAALKKLGVHFASSGNLLGAIISTTGTPLVGNLVSSVTKTLEKYIDTSRTSEQLHQEVAIALKSSNNRFLIVVDDLDRLSPEEAIVIFRLIKSVGRLPQVMYLLAYDRDVTERAVSLRYPSEGPHFLEKIVQAGFELPKPERDSLITLLGNQINQIINDKEIKDETRFGNLFHAIVVPEIRTPRDAIRLSNAFSTTWPSIRGDADLSDFLALETLRLFRPHLYRAIATHKAELVELNTQSPNLNRDEIAVHYDQIFLSSISEIERPRMKEAMMRLFPVLEGVWSNLHYSDTTQWLLERRVCASPHFDTYFRFSVSNRTVPKNEIEQIIDRSDDKVFIKEVLLEGMDIFQAEGRTKTSFILDEITANASKIPTENYFTFISTIFSIADKIWSDTDEAKGIGIVNNYLRLHWLTRALVLEKMKFGERSKLLFDSCQTASLEWLSDFSNTVYQNYQIQGDGVKKMPVPPETFLVTAKDAARIREFTLERIQQAAKDDSITQVRNLAAMLFRWHDMVDGETEEVRDWCLGRLSNNSKFFVLIRAFLDESYSYAMGGFGFQGDLVYRKSDYAKVDGLEKLIDPDVFWSRVVEFSGDENIPQEDREIGLRLLAVRPKEGENY